MPKTLCDFKTCFVMSFFDLRTGYGALKNVQICIIKSINISENGGFKKKMTKNF